MKRDHTASRQMCYWRIVARKEFKEEYFKTTRQSYLYWGEKKLYGLGGGRCAFSKYLDRSVYGVR